MCVCVCVCVCECVCVCVCVCACVCVHVSVFGGLVVKVLDWYITLWCQIRVPSVAPPAHPALMGWGASSPGSFSSISSGSGGTSGAHTTLAKRLSQASRMFLIPANPFGVYPPKHILTHRHAYWLHTPGFGSASLPLAQPTEIVRHACVHHYTYVKLCGK